jgi:hypothetical protein
MSTGPAAPAPRRAFQRRPISARSPLEGRQLWRVGDWGGASEHIGKQWEALGARALLTLLGVARPGPGGETYTPREAVIISATPDLAAQVQAHGKSHADAILVGTLNGEIVLEPVDFKWTLETAETKQVSTPVLMTLLDEPPPLLEHAILSAIQQISDASDGEPHLHDGIFLAPDTAANRNHLAPRGSMDPVWAALAPVSWEEFFPPLVGWNVALELARIERTNISTVEQAERFYRLGAGVRGGLRKLAAGIFSVEPAEFDDAAALATLQRDRKLRAVGDIVAYLDRALTSRSELVQLLRSMERGAYPFGRFAADLKAMGIDTRSEDRRWRVLYGAIMKPLGGQIREAGLALVQSGATEQQALETLAQRNAEWLRVARQLLRSSLATDAA